MTGPRCGPARELAAEFALGVLPAQEHAAVTSHLDACPQCRELVRQYADVTEELVGLVPAIEPPAELENRILAAVDPPPPPRARQEWPRRALLAAAVAAVSVGGLGGYVAGRSTTPTAPPEDDLAEALLYAPDRSRVGRVFLYGGDPAWMFVAVAGSGTTGRVACELRLRDGRTVAVGSFRLAGDPGYWGVPLGPIAAGSVSAVRLVTDGTLAASARFPS